MRTPSSSHRSRSPGEEVTFTVARGDAEQQLTAQLGDRGEFAFESGDEPGAPRLQGDSQAGFEDDRFGGIC